MFLGEYEHTIDIKGRVAIPAKFREDVAEGLVITRGFDQNLLVYPMDIWQELAAKINALPMSQPATRNLRRLLFASAANLQLDKQGRILVPANLRTYAGIETSAIIAGMDNFMEIWSQERWQAVIDSFPAQGAEIAAQVAELGI